LIGKGINNSVSKENLKEFLSTYLRSVKELGLEEMEGLLAFSDSKEKKIQMKNFDVDYWVIGHPNSYFDDDAGEGLKFVFTIFPSILTLGTIPLWSDEGISSNYFVFDKNLIQIATIQTENLHESVTAWWCFGGQVKMAGNSSIMDPPPAIFYKPNLQRFSKELVQVLKK
jgi:hypothetical protein